MDKNRILMDKASTVAILSKEGHLPLETYFLVMRCAEDEDGSELLIKADRISITEVINATICGASNLGVSAAKVIEAVAKAMGRFYKPEELIAEVRANDRPNTL